MTSMECDQPEEADSMGMGILIYMTRSTYKQKEQR